MFEYEPSNVFGRILRGELPSDKVYEDETILVIMDVYPQSRGHTLVIPKAPSRNLFDADPVVMAKVGAALPRLSRAVKAAMGAQGLRLLQFNEAASGQSVFHLHFHLIPIYEGKELAGLTPILADAGELREAAAAITAALG